MAITQTPDAQVIAVAGTSDSTTDKVIYGAYRSRVNANLPDGYTRDDCHTSSANCVKVPAAVYLEPDQTVNRQFRTTKHKKISIRSAQQPKSY